MRSVEMDFDANEGIAEGAVLRFLGTPILALPSLSFPLNDARKSGWLPPTINMDNRSGLELAMPYYWNIAPNRDATLAPRIITRRGLGLDAEFRYLEPGDGGTLQLNWLPTTAWPVVRATPWGGSTKAAGRRL
jgi:LPS-assembly protein